MQKLTYLNTAGEALTFHHAPYVLSSISGLGMSNIAITTSAGVYQDGETVRWMKRGKKEIKVTVSLVENTRKALYERRLEALSILSPEKAMKGTTLARLVYQNDQGSYWTWAVPMQGLEPSKRTRAIQPSMTVTFQCPTPFWYEQNENLLSFEKQRQGFTLPFAMPLMLATSRMQKVVVNRGQRSAPLSIEIKGSGEKPVILNQTTGAKITFVEPLPSGETLLVETDPADLSVRVIGENGKPQNAFGYLDPASSIASFVLVPGANIIQYVPQGDRSETRIFLRWYNAFEGV